MRIISYIEINTKIVGVTHQCPNTGVNRQDLIRAYVRPGMQLDLTPEPNNPFDDQAISVTFEKRIVIRKQRVHLGYLPQSRARQVQTLLAEGKKLIVFVNEVTGGTKEKPTRGVNLTIQY